MKKPLLILIILLNLGAAFGQDFTFPAEFDYPRLEKYGQKIEDFVPKNWKIIGKAIGDLNGDKIADSTIIVKGSDAKF